MLKIMGISLAAILIVFSFLGRTYIKKQEQTYDDLRLMEVKNVQRALQTNRSVV